VDRVWGTIRKDHRITASFDMECPPFFWKREDTLVAVLEVLCLRLEAPHPVWLNKHTAHPRNGPLRLHALFQRRFH